MVHLWTLFISKSMTRVHPVCLCRTLKLFILNNVFVFVYIPAVWHWKHPICSIKIFHVVIQLYGPEKAPHLWVFGFAMWILPPLLLQCYIECESFKSCREIRCPILHIEHPLFIKKKKKSYKLNTRVFFMLFLKFDLIQPDILMYLENKISFSVFWTHAYWPVCTYMHCHDLLHLP